MMDLFLASTAHGYFDPVWPGPSHLFAPTGYHLADYSTQRFLPLPQPHATLVELVGSSGGSGSRSLRSVHDELADDPDSDPISSPSKSYYHDKVKAASLAVRSSSGARVRPRPYDRKAPLVVEEPYRDKVTPVEPRKMPTEGVFSSAILHHQDIVQAELKDHRTKPIPAFIPLTTAKIRFEYVRSAQLPPPGPLLINGSEIARAPPLLPPLAEPEWSMVFTHTSWAGTKKRGQSPSHQHLGSRTLTAGPLDICSFRQA
jgi:hypothetical protein